MVARVYPASAGKNSWTMGMGKQWLAVVVVASHSLPLASVHLATHLFNHSVCSAKVSEYSTRYRHPLVVRLELFRAFYRRFQ